MSPLGVQAERITMLDLRHSPWCEGLDCVDSGDLPEEPQQGTPGEDVSAEGGSQLEGAGSVDDSISSSLQLVLPRDFVSSRVNSKLVCGDTLRSPPLSHCS